MKTALFAALVLSCSLALDATAATGKDDHDHAAVSHDATAGAFHLHVIPLKASFEVHVHSVAKHESVDLSKARTKATLLADGKTTIVPLTVKGKGILTSAQALPKQWTLLVALTVPGQPPAQARFTSTKASRHAH